MKRRLRVFLIMLLLGAFPAQAAGYKYAHNDAEYSVMLPEAPAVETIWADAGNVPYLENPPKDGAIGEIATFRRVAMETEESFAVKITFVKADDDFLTQLTEEKMKETLENDFKWSFLKEQKFSFSTDPKSTLKWATVSGFSLDQKKRPFYSTGHYLAGKQSIMLIKVQYNVENETFDDYYRKLSDNITYLAQ